VSKQSNGGRGPSLTGGALAGRPPIPAVNLMPASVDQAHANRALQAKILVVLCFVVILLGGGYVGVTFWKGTADARVTEAQEEAARLKTEKKQYAELIDVNRQLDEAKAAEVASMGYELRWADLLQVMVDTRPPGSLVASIGGLSMSASQELSPSTNVLARPAVGRLTIVLQVVDFVDAAQWLDTLDATPGLEMAHCGSYNWLEAGEGVGVYEIQCSAEANLAGLSGKALPQEFNDWLTAQKEGGGEAGDGDSGDAAEGGDE
jgi:hypothetical protein